MAVSESQLVRRRIHDIINESQMATKLMSGDGSSGGDRSALVEDRDEGFAESGIEAGRRWIMETVKRHNGQVIIPVLPDGKVLALVRYSAAAKKWLVCFPSGFGIDGEENWRDTAERILLSEVGMASIDLRVVGGTSLTSCSESSDFGVILARKCAPVVSENADPINGQQLEMSFDCLEDLIVDGEVECCLTMSALTAFKAFRRKMELKRA